MNRILKLHFVLTILLLLAPHKAFAGTSGANFPVGAPDGLGYYDAQDFGTYNDDFDGYHLGEDWNKSCPGDCDFGEEISSIGSGKVVLSSYLRTWGNVVIIQHDVSKGVSVNALYAHLNTVLIRKGDIVKIGQKIGTIGKGDRNRFAAHLHFEIRSDLGIGVGTGYGARYQKGYVNPSDFIKAHRPVSGSTLTLSNPSGKSIQASWSKSDSTRFSKYELYRSDVAGDSEKRSLIFSTAKVDELTFLDSAVSVGTHYYVLVTYFSNGFTAESDEKSITTTYTPNLIDDTYGMQIRPFVYDGKIFWDNTQEPPAGKPHSIIYYDIKLQKKVNVDIVGPGSHGIQFLSAGGGYAVFSSGGFVPESGSSMNVYGLELATGNAFLVSGVRYDEQNPSVSENGVVVWADPRGDLHDYNIYMLDLNKSEGPKPLVTMTGNDKWPIISGDYVIWHRDGKSGPYHDLYLKSLDGSHEKIIVKDYDEYYADISGNDIVYVKNGNLWAYSIKDGTAREINGGGKIQDPRIRDGRIAYIQNKQIHVYDLVTNKDQVINTGAMTVFYPYIAGDTLVFNTIKPGTTLDYDVYLIEL